MASSPKSALRARKVKLDRCGVVAVSYQKRCETFHRKRTKKIHARRIIPGVPQGVQRPDPSPSRALEISRAKSLGRDDAGRALRARSGSPILAATDDLAIVHSKKITAVAGQSTASSVCEPSCASNGDVVFYTGNWFAAVSGDGGATFQYVNPYTAFPDPPGMGFCCDQVVHYIESIDTFVWLLQYTEDAAGENIQRLAFARTADVLTGQWQTFDLTPANLGLPGTFLDFPDLAVGTNMLYVTTNGFQGSGWSSTILVRLPLAGIQSGSVTGQVVVSTSNFNFRVAQNTGTTAFYGSHEDTATLRVFSWPEGATNPTSTDVPVATWSAAMPYNSQGPDNRHWLRRADPRLTGATRAGNELWFAWTANAGGTSNRPHPYVQIARISSTTMTLIENVSLWLNVSAVAYPALATNTNDEVGVSCMVGGGFRHPSHAVGILTGTTKGAVAARGGQGPSGTQWGDYLAIRRHVPNGKLFCASGFTQRAGASSNDSTPNYVVFGRSSDVVAP